MASLSEKVFQTIQVQSDRDICRIRICRPNDNNTINGALIYEIAEIVDFCEVNAKIVVLEGSAQTFCLGADFTEISGSLTGEALPQAQEPGPLYELWRRLAFGPYITIAHVRGRVNAGGMGFVAACDLVLCEEKAVFSLSEMLFGLLPACVLPFLIRRIGSSRANYMTLTTQPVGAQQALSWGLVDACEENSEDLLRKHLLRLRRLSKPAISRYKRYVESLSESVRNSRPAALLANAEVFSDARNLANIDLYVRTGQFPWEDRQ